MEIINFKLVFIIIYLGLNNKIYLEEGIILY